MGESISETFGWVRATAPNTFSPYDIIGVIWGAAESAPELDAVVEEVLAALERYGLEGTNRGPVVTSMQDEHEIVSQHFNIVEEELSLTGVAGSRYCDEASRVYVSYYATIPELATQEDLLTEFQQYLDSSAYH